jgi:hypothetical protein
MTGLVASFHPPQRGIKGSLVAPQDYPTLAAQPSPLGAEAKDQSDYQLWESLVARPWHTDELSYVEGLWWDTEACARQLPYHRILALTHILMPSPAGAKLAFKPARVQIAVYCVYTLDS